MMSNYNPTLKLDWLKLPESAGDQRDLPEEI